MKVQRLSLSNYRGFTQLDLEFGPKITVLAGVNGSGKSGVLRGLAVLLSHLLREVGASRERAEALNSGDVQIGKPALTLGATFASSVQILHAQLTRAISDPSKAEEYARRRDAARSAIRETKKGSKEEKRLKEEIRFLGELLDGDRDHFSRQIEAVKTRGKAKAERGTHPIAVLYTTSRYLGRLAPRLSGARAFEPANAYTDALSGAVVSLAAFANWFNAVQQGALGSKANSKRIFSLLNGVVKNMLPGFSEPRLADSTPPRFFVKKGKMEFELHQLSDGERGLLALAFDLTRRLAIANPGLKNPVAEADAIILLDEIELHLHPSWQRKVLRRLARTFKKCQFVATSHSPQVLGEVEGKNIRYLKRSNGKITSWTPQRALGLDSNRVLEELMDSPSRNEAIDAESHEVFRLIDQEKFAAARKQLVDVEAKLGDSDPDVVRARSLMAFLEGRK